MYQIDLITRDGAQFRFAAEPGETLLDAAARAGHYLPSVCRVGCCGSCHVTSESDAVVMDTFSEAALPKTERDAGGILLCRARARGDLRLRGAFDQDAVGSVPIPRRFASIVALEPLAARTMRLALKYEDDPTWGSGADFVPGQFVELYIPGTDTSRAYSIANTPNWDGHLEFLIRLQPGGAFSQFLTQGARVGDRIGVRGPEGTFTADDASQAPRWFVAGGTGLAPVLSMLGHMVEFADPRPCHLFFGVNSEEELFGRQRIAQIAAALPGLAVTVCVWRPSPQWSGFKGTPADAFADSLATCSTHPDVYVCGPPALVDAVIGHAGRAGISHDRIFSERCLPAAK